MRRQQELCEQANAMLKRAYVPYSNFPVGAALLTSDDEIYTGCNIENSSYGLTNCAERTAIFKAVSEGVKAFDGLVITGKTEDPISPCGACRQVIAEFCPPDMPIILTNEKGDIKETTVEGLLPYYFEAEDMDYARK
ncbi:cytidine deaminase [Allofustis seminis]|uniref:cytidine deaminase n=1 Tax=Allofustis seminis TaxID=166939 RepID=UPI000362553D|nr:cytidine deaminase [Allofustis seminis]